MACKTLFFGYCIKCVTPLLGRVDTVTNSMSLTLLLRWKGKKQRSVVESLFHAQAEWDGNKYKFQPLRWSTRSFETQYIQLNEINPLFQWKENTAWVVRERNLTDTCGFQQKESNYTANLLFMHNFLKYGLKLLEIFIC